MKVSLDSENYYAELEFYRLLSDETIPHEERIKLLKTQLTVITNTINGIRLIEALLPEQPIEPEKSPDLDQQVS
ncbi:MAG: hypothetical protein HC836_15725 [Richelia sp. RM2_1_2]|nr:hypothetical protein [Richelia sp. RM2_1_2]